MRCSTTEIFSAISGENCCISAKRFTVCPRIFSGNNTSSEAGRFAAQLRQHHGNRLGMFALHELHELLRIGFLQARRN